MSGIADVNPVAVFEGDGSRGPFPFEDAGQSIPFAANAHLSLARVSTAGVISELTLGVHYDLTVTLDSATSLYTAVINLRSDQPVLAGASGSSPAEKLVAWREQPLDQSLTVNYNQAFPSRSFNQLHNKLLQIAQEHRSVMDRAVLAPRHEVGLTLGDKLVRKGKVLGGDPSTGVLRMLTLAEAADASSQVILAEYEFEAEAGGQSVFTLTNTGVTEPAALLVHVGGAAQPVSAYTVALDGDDTQLTFGEEVDEGVVVLVRVLGAHGVTDVGVSAAMTPVVQGSTLPTLTVATKAALSALSAGFVPSVFVQGRSAAGDGGGGVFRWSASDHSADVTADTLGGIYAAPNSDTDGSSGAWVRVAPGGFILPEWFGAAGDGATNCAAAWAACEIMADRTDKRMVWWLGENYYFNTTLIVTKNNILHKGAGPRQTAWTFNHTSNGVQIGTSALHIQNARFEGISYQQASGAAYAFDYYNGRNLQIIDAGNSSVRNWMKVGSQCILVTGAADNGSGLVRLTLASDAFATGDIVYVNAVGGVTGATGQFTLTRISSGVYDLQGSTFGGSWTSGGRVAPHVTQLTHQAGVHDSIIVNDLYGLDVYGIAGTVRFFGKPLWECENITGGAPDAGTTWLNVRKASQVYDRLDWVEATEGTGGRRFETGVKVDDTRVVSLELAELHLDGCTTPISIVFDSVDFTGGGMDRLRITDARVGLDSNTSQGASVITATAAIISNAIIEGYDADTYGGGIAITGGTISNGFGVTSLIINDVMVAMRPASSTYDAVTIAGYVNGIISKVNADKPSGAGAARDGVRVASSHEGFLQINGVQTDGMSGNAFHYETGVSASLSRVIARDLQNSSTTANRWSDADGKALIEEAPGQHRGARRQRFQFHIRNNGGTIEHRIGAATDDSVAANPEDVVKISGASNTLATTPTGADSSTAMASGGKIGSATAYRFHFDTAAQTAANIRGIASVVANTTGDNVMAWVRTSNININGVSQRRLAIEFRTPAGTWDLNTTNIGNGELVILAVEAWLA